MLSVAVHVSVQCNLNTVQSTLVNTKFMGSAKHCKLTKLPFDDKEQKSIVTSLQHASLLDFVQHLDFRCQVEHTTWVVMIFDTLELKPKASTTQTPHMVLAQQKRLRTSKERGAQGGTSLNWPTA